jgi:hypothetical protein
MNAYGSSAEGLWVDYAMRQYNIHNLNRNAVSVSLAISEDVKIAKSRGYVDLLLGPLELGGE